MKKQIGNIKNYIFLNEVTRRGRQRGSMKKYWEIEFTTWRLSPGNDWIKSLQAVRDICDPLRRKSGPLGRKWKFRSITTADQCYTFLALKFS